MNDKLLKRLKLTLDFIYKFTSDNRDVNITFTVNPKNGRISVNIANKFGELLKDNDEAFVAFESGLFSYLRRNGYR
jgi:hypothetical protein